MGNHNPNQLSAALGLTALMPALCVLWFMTVAMRNERLAVQEQMADVYLNQLAALQRQTNAFWKERQMALSSLAGESGAGKFAAAVRSGVADAVVIHDAAGKVLYPGAALLDAAPAESAEWTAARDLEFHQHEYRAAADAYARIAETSRDIHGKARALQAEAACRLKAGDKMTALARLSQISGDPTLRNAVNPQGTLITLSAQLLLLKLLSAGPASPALRERTLDELVVRLNDYSAANFPAPQRRFLMHEVGELVAIASGRSLRAGDQTSESAASSLLPMKAAEDLAADYLESNAPVAPDGKIQRTPMPKVWRFASADRTVVALYREERLKAEVEKLFSAATPSDVRVRLVAPAEPVAAHKLVPPQDAGDFMPGWRLALSFRGVDPLAEASARQMRFYLWTGSTVVVIIALLALLVARYVTAQMRLARLKNELVSTVSHELKTPLASMRALVDTLLADRCRDPMQRQEYLQLIAKENLRLSHLIDNFLAFSRMERGQQRFRFEPTPPESLVHAAADALAERLTAPDCHFAKEIAPGLPAIRVDADALTTVLVNLLDNACKYVNGPRRIGVRVNAAAGAVVFAVSDNGIGIPPAETRRIFDRFYQVDQSLTRQRGGCGLGLAIVQAIVRAHGGTVKVESEPGKGSTFRVKIPVASSADTGEATPAAVLKPVDHGLHGWNG